MPRGSCSVPRGSCPVEKTRCPRWLVRSHCGPNDKGRHRERPAARPAVAHDTRTRRRTDRKTGRARTRRRRTRHPPPRPHPRPARAGRTPPRPRRHARRHRLVRRRRRTTPEHPGGPRPPAAPARTRRPPRQRDPVPTRPPAGPAPRDREPTTVPPRRAHIRHRRRRPPRPRAGPVPEVAHHDQRGPPRRGVVGPRSRARRVGVDRARPAPSGRRTQGQDHAARRRPCPPRPGHPPDDRRAPARTRPRGKAGGQGRRPAAPAARRSIRFREPARRPTMFVVGQPRGPAPGRVLDGGAVRRGRPRHRRAGGGVAPSTPRQGGRPRPDTTPRRHPRRVARRGPSRPRAAT